MKTPIVITTINKPTKAVKEFSKLSQFTLHISGDNKTGSDWKWRNSHFLSIDDQKKKYPKFHKLVSENHYARKNFAYLTAMESGSSYIYETDDDNLPYSNFPNFVLKCSNYDVLTFGKSSNESVFNIYSVFTKKHIWPRGFPLDKIKAKISFKIKKEKRFPLIQQSLADLDPDVDAIYRLTIGNLLRFKKNKRVILKEGIYCPFNSQNTLWQKKVFPLMYLPSTINPRVTDIWRGYIAQKIAWDLGTNLAFISPSVYQERNPHNYLKDFRDEVDLYLKVNNLIEALQSIKLGKDIKNDLLIVYTELVKQKYFQEKELFILNEWLNYCDRLC